jgi:hypothetical protein
VEGDFVVIGARKDFGKVWKTTFKTIDYGKVGIQLPCGIEGVSHGEACARFGGAQNFVTGSAYNGR